MRRVAVFADALAQVVDDALGGARDGAEADHRALGPAGRARGVDDHRQFVLGTLRPARQRRGARDDRVPGVEGGASAPAASAMQRQAGRHAGLLLRPAVELADEQQAGLAVAEHVAHGLGGLGGEDRHRGVAGQPDGQLGHEEVRAVLRQDGDARAAREALRSAGARPCAATGRAPGPRCSRSPRPPPSGCVRKTRSGWLASWSSTWSRISGVSHGASLLAVLASSLTSMLRRGRASAPLPPRPRCRALVDQPGVDLHQVGAGVDLGQRVGAAHHAADADDRIAACPARRATGG